MSILADDFNVTEIHQGFVEFCVLLFGLDPAEAVSNVGNLDAFKRTACTEAAIGEVAGRMSKERVDDTNHRRNTINMPISVKEVLVSFKRCLGPAVGIQVAAKRIIAAEAVGRVFVNKRKHFAISVFLHNTMDNICSVQGSQP